MGYPVSPSEEDPLEKNGVSEPAGVHSFGKSEAVCLKPAISFKMRDDDGPTDDGIASTRESTSSRTSSSTGFVGLVLGVHVVLTCLVLGWYQISLWRMEAYVQDTVLATSYLDERLSDVAQRQSERSGIDLLDANRRLRSQSRLISGLSARILRLEKMEKLSARKQMVDARSDPQLVFERLTDDPLRRDVSKIARILPEEVTTWIEVDPHDMDWQNGEPSGIWFDDQRQATGDNGRQRSQRLRGTSSNERAKDLGSEGDVFYLQPGGPDGLAWVENVPDYEWSLDNAKLNTAFPVYIDGPEEVEPFQATEEESRLHKKAEYWESDEDADVGGSGRFRRAVAAPVALSRDKSSASHNHRAGTLDEELEASTEDEHRHPGSRSRTHGGHRDFQRERKHGHHEESAEEQREARERKRMEKRRNREARKRAKEPKGVGVHFTGDLPGLGRPQSSHIVHGWLPAGWTQTDPSAANFILDRSRQLVRVTTSGLFYIYAQITYHNTFATNGHGLYVNDKLLYQCMHKISASQMESGEGPRAAQGSSCYVGGVWRLADGDTVSVRLRYRGRTIMMERGLSYFGMVRLGG